ncbi:MAG: sensor histidine kinase [Ornithinimicrobium sp.]|uniref:sensor histidine kinase n=1 Tax=Ornithinimicrobium sp. TaxID=1977084 RepID=UPI0026E00A18|nr:sensor histidine kinase [Ornithinimicrobium sp.]MDO5739299.1 sensor histidine kinase [Ornithinimicrobium sp.]
MSTDAERHNPTGWSGVLDLISATAFLLAALSVGTAFTEGVGPGLFLLGGVGVAALLWIRVRQEHEAWAAYGLTAVALVCTAFPSGGPYAYVLLVVAVALLGFVVGLGAALGAVAIIVLTLALTLVATYDPGLLDTVRQTAGVAALLLVGAGFGGLLRTLDRARSTALHRGMELETTNERLRAALVTEREFVLAQERARSARELHDGLGHRLTLVAMSLQYAERMQDRDPVKAWAEVATAASTNQGALDLMRLWARALDPPPHAAGVGGAAAFDAIAEAFRGTGLDVAVTHRGSDDSLPEQISLFATRFVQEGLTNVLRHADATRVTVDFLQSPQQVRIALRDDGRGAAVPHDGFGLRSLRERAAALGGTLTSGVVVDGGWQLVVVLPLSDDHVPALVGEAT